MIEETKLTEVDKKSDEEKIEEKKEEKIEEKKNEEEKEEILVKEEKIDEFPPAFENAADVVELSEGEKIRMDAYMLYIKNKLKEEKKTKVKREDGIEYKSFSDDEDNHEEETDEEEESNVPDDAKIYYPLPENERDIYKSFSQYSYVPPSILKKKRVTHATPPTPIPIKKRRGEDVQYSSRNNKKTPFFDSKIKFV